MSPNILGGILLHFCPWKHFKVHSHIHSVDTSCITCRFKPFNLGCEVTSNVGSVFSSPASLGMKIFHGTSSWMLLGFFLSPRPTIHNSTLALCHLPMSVFYQSGPIIKIELKCHLFSAAFQVCLEAIIISSFTKPLHTCPRLFVCHLLDTTFFFNLYFCMNASSP